MLDQLRDWMEDNRQIAIVAVVITVLALFGLSYLVTGMISGGSSTGSYTVWFYDVGSGKLFEADSHAVSPIKPPSGKEDFDGEPGGLRAYVYGCGACTEEFMQPVYLERFTPESRDAARQLFRQGPSLSPDQRRELQKKVDAGRQIRRPDDQSWQRADKVIDKKVDDNIEIITTHLDSILEAFARICEDQEAGVVTCLPE